MLVAELRLRLVTDAALPVMDVLMPGSVDAICRRFTPISITWPPS